LNITNKIDHQTQNATLTDGLASRNFLALPPLTLILEDYAETEKIAYLPKKLTTTGARTGRAVRVRAIIYYAPWGNLALLHKTSIAQPPDQIGSV
jgi:hypothetical protein